MPTIIEDTRQQVHHGDKHAAKHRWWAAHGVDVVRKKLDFGDYTVAGSNIVVDTKRNVAEIAQNIGGRQHARFKDECVRAQEAGHRLYILVENVNGYHCLNNVNAWTNDHCKRCRYYKVHSCDPRRMGKCKRHGTQKPIQGPRLAKAMQTMTERYGVVFLFCHPREAARVVCELLGVRYE